MSFPKYLKKIPVEEWKAFEVSRWLCHIGVGEYALLFHNHNVTGDVLLSITEEDMFGRPMQLTTFGKVRKISIELAKLKIENEALKAELKSNSSLRTDDSSSDASSSPLSTDFSDD